MGKSNAEMLLEAKELKEKRELMGYTAIEICLLTKTNQGNYSKMERGLLNCEKPLEKVKQLYVEWSKKEAKRLKEQATYIQSL